MGLAASSDHERSVRVLSPSSSSVFAALPGYPVRAVGDLVDAVEEGQAPGDLALGDIVPGALHLGLDEDADRPGPLLENRRLEDEEAELLAVDVLLRLEDVALLDLDSFRLGGGCGIYWTYFDGSGDEQSGPAEGREARDGTA